MKWRLISSTNCSVFGFRWFLIIRIKFVRTQGVRGEETQHRDDSVHVVLLSEELRGLPSRQSVHRKEREDSQQEFGPGIFSFEQLNPQQSQAEHLKRNWYNVKSRNFVIKLDIWFAWLRSRNVCFQQRFQCGCNKFDVGLSVTCFQFGIAIKSINILKGCFKMTPKQKYAVI